MLFHQAFASARLGSDAHLALALCRWVSDVQPQDMTNLLRAGIKLEDKRRETFNNVIQAIPL